MALTLVTEAGADDANSYSSLADADLYHAGHAYAETWDDASSDEKARALVTATRMLDANVIWYGAVSTNEQSLLWPRTSMTNPRQEAEPLASDIIPQELVNATAELARLMLQSDRTKDSEIASQGIQKVDAGPVAITFNPNFSLESTRSNVLPDSVFFWIDIWGRLKRRNPTNVRLVRS